MRFIEAVNGDLIAVSTIVKVRRGKWNTEGFSRETGKVYVEGGDYHGIEVGDDAITQMLNELAPVIPAQPGYFLLGYYYDAPRGEVDWIDEEPIVGWRVEADNDLIPLITERGHDGYTGINGILRPDGTVTDLFGSTFKTRADWEAYMKDKLDEEHKRRVASAAPAPSQRTE